MMSHTFFDLSGFSDIWIIRWCCCLGTLAKMPSKCSRFFNVNIQSCAIEVNSRVPLNYMTFKIHASFFFSGSVDMSSHWLHGYTVNILFCMTFHQLCHLIQTFSFAIMKHLHHEFRGWLWFNCSAMQWPAVAHQASAQSGSFFESLTMTHHCHVFEHSLKSSHQSCWGVAESSALNKPKACFFFTCYIEQACFRCCCC